VTINVPLTPAAVSQLPLSTVPPDSAHVSLAPSTPLAMTTPPALAAGPFRNSLSAPTCKAGSHWQPHPGGVDSTAAHAVTAAALSARSRSTSPRKLYHGPAEEEWERRGREGARPPAVLHEESTWREYTPRGMILSVYKTARPSQRAPWRTASQPVPANIARARTAGELAG
jgi:hypothetical protein